MKTHCLPYFHFLQFFSLLIFQAYAHHTRISPIVSDLVEIIPSLQSVDHFSKISQFRYLDALLWAFEGSGQGDPKKWSAADSSYIIANGNMNLIKKSLFQGQSSPLRIYKPEDVSRWLRIQLFRRSNNFKITTKNLEAYIRFWCRVFPNAFSKAFGAFVAQSKTWNSALKKKDLLPKFIAQVRLEAYHRGSEDEISHLRSDSSIQRRWILLLKETKLIHSAPIGGKLDLESIPVVPLQGKSFPEITAPFNCSILPFFKRYSTLAIF